jgi:hypothetical protein
MLVLKTGGFRHVHHVRHVRYVSFPAGDHDELSMIPPVKLMSVVLQNCTGQVGAAATMEGGWRSILYPWSAHTRRRRHVKACMYTGQNYNRQGEWRIRSAAGMALHVAPHVTLQRPALIDNLNTVWYVICVFVPSDGCLAAVLLLCCCMDAVRTG